jgi:hypothetical protein
MRKLLICILTTSLFCLGTDVLGQSKSSSSGSRPSFSGGSKPPSSKPPSFSGGKSPNSNKPSFSGGKSSSGNKPSFSGGGTATSGGRPKNSSFDSKAAAAQQRAESKQQMQRAEAPRESYTVNGRTINIDPKDRKIQSLRQQLDHERWSNRELRQHNFYQSYYGRPVVVYHDPYSTLFWYYLLDRSIEQQAMWAYCHRADMDAARYNALLSRDARLAGRVAELERQNAARDPNYVLTGMDPDLQYSDEYIDAVYNPRPPPNYVGWTVLWVFIGLIVIATALYLIFFKEY